MKGFANRSRHRRTTSSVEVPIDPVEPSKVMEVNGFDLNTAALPPIRRLLLRAAEASSLCLWGSIWFGVRLGKDQTLAGAGEDCFRGLFYEVSLALVGVASPA
jgi:hypothetical protein